MWGTQVMQRLAGEVRVAENAIVRAEKWRLTLAYTKAWNGRLNVSMRMAHASIVAAS